VKRERESMASLRTQERSVCWRGNCVVGVDVRWTLDSGLMSSLVKMYNNFLHYVNTVVRGVSKPALFKDAGAMLDGIP
jgi:hypothetical protein